MTPPATLSLCATAGRLNRRLGHVVFEVAGTTVQARWHEPTELDVPPGTHEVIAYLVLADTPWGAARARTGARRVVTLRSGQTSIIRFRPSRLFSGAYHGRITMTEVPAR